MDALRAETMAETMDTCSVAHWAALRVVKLAGQMDTSMAVHSADRLADLMAASSATRCTKE